MSEAVIAPKVLETPNLPQPLRAPDLETLDLCLRFLTDPSQREPVLTLFGFLETLLDIGTKTTEPLMAEIRLQWWRDHIEALRQNAVLPYHPVLAEFEALWRRGLLDLGALVEMIEAVSELYEGPKDLPEASGLCDRLWGKLVHQGASWLCPQALDPEVKRRLSLAIRPYGLARLRRLKGLAPHLEWSDLAPIVSEARKAASGLELGLWPLILPSRLAKALWFGQGLSPLGLRLRLTGAMILGRL